MPEKDVVGNVTSDLIALLPTTIIAYITIWQFTQVYEKTFNVNSKINSSNNAKYLKFHCRKVDSARKWHFSDNPGDFRL